MSSLLPAGWPPGVRPPGEADWEHDAVAFLFDCCPPDYRRYSLLRRHPVVLATFAAHFVAGHVEATRTGVTRLRVDLARYCSPEVVAAAVETWLEQGAALARTQRAVGLVEEALRAAAFVPRE